MSVHLLVLEDDTFCLDLLQTALTAAGHVVSVCHTPEEILALSRRFPQAIALVDFWGRSQLRLRDDERAEFMNLVTAVPTILVTSRHWAEKCQPEEIGVLAILAKPFTIGMLYSTVEECGARAQSLQARFEPLSNAGETKQTTQLSSL